MISHGVVLLSSDSLRLRFTMSFMISIPVSSVARWGISNLSGVWNTDHGTVNVWFRWLAQVSSLASPSGTPLHYC